MKNHPFPSLVLILFLLLSFSPVSFVRAAAIVPQDGNWSGTIDRGNAMSFTIMSSGTQWSNFQLSYDFTGSGCGNPFTSFTTGVDGPGSISNGSFSWSGLTDAYTGHFITPTTATGTYSFTNRKFTVYPNGIPCNFYLTASGTWSASVALPPPGAFSKISPADTATNQSAGLTLSWEASSNATSYEYCYGMTNPCSNWTDNGASTSKVLSGLTPETTYYWQVRAKNTTSITLANGGTVWSFSVGQVSYVYLYLPLVTKPAQPLGSFNKIGPANNATNQLTGSTLSWSASGNATSYEYCIDTINDNTCNGTGSWISNAASTSIGLSDLAVSTTYHWQVRARNALGTLEADSGTWWSFTTTSSMPPTAGYWLTNIGDDFYVTPDQASVVYFRIYFTATSCHGWVRHNNPTPIASNQFSFTGSIYASGTFDSPTSAHGNDGLNNYNLYDCGYITGGPYEWTATWQNNSQPTGSSNVNGNSGTSVELSPFPTQKGHPID